jgi:hypothetical protein
LKKKIAINQISEIKRLSTAGYSLTALSKMLSISKSTIYYHAKNSCRKMSKFDVSLLNEEERGYLIGFFIGDGSFNRGNKEPRFFVRFALDAKRDKDIALRLTKIFRKAGKRTSLFPYKSNIIAKTCSKEFVAYIQSYVEYNQGGKNLKHSEDLSENFKYGLVAGLIDSDGHVHEHLGTEIKTVSTQIFKSAIGILREIGISANTKVRDAPSNSFSKKPRFEIYIPSAQIKLRKDKIPSVKIARYLATTTFSEKH